MKRSCPAVIASILCLIFSGSLLSRAQDVPAPDPIIRAMSDELERSIMDLQFKDLEKPYFIQYVTLDRLEYRAEATFGALIHSDEEQSRILQAQVRVGSYDFDNSEFVAGGRFRGPPPSGVLSSIVVENDYDVIRHSLWLATDAAYKQAVEQLAEKRAFLKNRISEEQIPDFSRESPTVAVKSRGILDIDKSRWENQLRQWSAIFKEFPEIQESTVSLRALLTNRYLVNSEGTRTLQPSVIVALEIVARTEAADGMRLSHSLPFIAASFDKLPSRSAVSDAIRQMAADLTALRSAPLLDADYSGPVLFTGQASAEMFARVLAPNLSGQRFPLAARSRGGPANRSELLDRINRPVLPSFLSAYDDPTEQGVKGQELVGHYNVDDQGVPAQRVSLIEDGVLRTLLMSRRPAQDMLQSNGHGRSGLPGRETAQIGNLFIQASEGKSYEDLEQQLLQLCRTEKLQYCIVIKALRADGRSPIGIPVLTYKVDVETGNEELVRGVSAMAIPVRSLREIEAAGNDAFVENRLTGARALPTPTSVIAPSVLLEEMELKKPTGSQDRPTLLTHPYFSSN